MLVVGDGDDSFSRTALNVARVAALASLIWPAPPLVSEITRTSAPALAYLAKVPPAQTVSSSGWAKIPNTRRGRRLEAFTEVLCATITIASTCRYELNLWIGRLVGSAPYPRRANEGAPASARR